MQVCFFALSRVIPIDLALERIKDSIQKTYAKRGPDVVAKNIRAVEMTLGGLHEAYIGREVSTPDDHIPTIPLDAPDFVRRVTSMIIEGRGDLLPVSALPVDGTFPTGTSKYEKRGIAHELPIWDTDLCTQCGLCPIVCPHAAIRTKAYGSDQLAQAPRGFRSVQGKGKEYAGHLLTIQVAPDDCTGCGLCVDICPVKDKNIEGRKALNMEPKEPYLQIERAGFEFFQGIKSVDPRTVPLDTIRGSQLREPLFEFSGACRGCGETPYLKLLSQLFGDRLLIANATGCSSIFGGNLPTTPWCTNEEGRGPAWSNSLFEDNAEFGMGMRLGVTHKQEYARLLLRKLAPKIGDELVNETLDTTGASEDVIAAQRLRVAQIKKRLEEIDDPDVAALASVVDTLTRRSVWIVGGDGWAYDIGFGGVDHVLASGIDVKLLVLDTEVYSNTGGQASKATPRAAVAKFAAGGKTARKKDLGLLAMGYGNVYVAQIAIGANPKQTIHALAEAESYDGPSLIIAYSHCTAHGIDMDHAMTHQKEAVQSGYWPLYRFDPRRANRGEIPMQLDSRRPKIPFREFAMKEGRFTSLLRSDPERAERLLQLAEQDVADRRRMYEQLAGTGREIGSVYQQPIPPRLPTTRIMDTTAPSSERDNSDSVSGARPEAIPLKQP